MEAATPTLANGWLGAAVGVSLTAQHAVVYPPLGRYFGTARLGQADWGFLAVALTAGGLGFPVVGWLLKPRMTAGTRQRTENGASEGVRPEVD